MFLVSPYQTYGLFDGCLLRPCNCYIINLESIGSLLTIAPRTEAQSLLFDSGQRQKILFFPTARNPADHSTTHKMCNKGSFLKGKLPNHMHTCKVQVMNFSNYTTTPPYVFTMRCFKQKNIFDFINSSLSPSVHSTFVNAP